MDGMDGTKIMTQPAKEGLPGGLLLGILASSGLWVLIAELRHFV
ncbi:hypothetical protein FHS31_001444 [Sphingomonas vulcanisoli]|uniref:Uncharacterized protein n=1 Tax=Sphingomonas vulcanisoli TaxID=1658060 RepID=A0ABX0TUJ4_9SPHN|nr:hypothetical protein [Sphingomonas vulcanisoli]NIJ07834.1 hypothetical protein [Sphingomonas vulcanisoli]